MHMSDLDNPSGLGGSRRSGICSSNRAAEENSIRRLGAGPRAQYRLWFGELGRYDSRVTIGFGSADGSFGERIL